MVNECLDDASIRTAAIEAMTKDSIIGENLEDVNESDLEIEELMREPDSVIEEFMVSTSHVKDENKTSTKTPKESLAH